MDIDIESKLYYKQYDLNYEVKPKGKAIKKADRLKLNLYFNPTLRGEQQRTLDIKIAGQKLSLNKSVIKQGGDNGQGQFQGRAQLLRDSSRC